MEVQVEENVAEWRRQVKKWMPDYSRTRWGSTCDSSFYRAPNRKLKRLCINTDI
jgi:hypothetical protein